MHLLLIICLFGCLKFRLLFFESGSPLRRSVISNHDRLPVEGPNPIRLRDRARRQEDEDECEEGSRDSSHVLCPFRTPATYRSSDSTASNTPRAVISSRAAVVFPTMQLSVQGQTNSPTSAAETL